MAGGPYAKINQVIGEGRVPVPHVKERESSLDSLCLCLWRKAIANEKKKRSKASRLLIEASPAADERAGESTGVSCSLEWWCAMRNNEFTVMSFDS